MAEPVSASVMAAKATAAMLKSEKGRKVFGWIIVIISAPIIVGFIVTLGFVSGVAQHNDYVIEYCFKGGEMPEGAPDEYVRYLVSVKIQLDKIDDEVGKVNDTIEESLDGLKVKTIFYVIYQNFDDIESVDIQKFVSCFYSAESPISDISEVANRLKEVLNIDLTAEKINEADALYYIIVNETDPLIYYRELLDQSDYQPFNHSKPNPIDGFYPPVLDWEIDVSSEFGHRIHPITGLDDFHNAIDITKPLGTPVFASLDGVVTISGFDASYGYFIKIDHGDGLETLYAHNSKLMVTVGEEVTAGQKIAEIGSTGDSTGDHLHFEVIEHGVAVNPREYLEESTTD